MTIPSGKGTLDKVGRAKNNCRFGRVPGCSRVEVQLFNSREAYATLGRIKGGTYRFTHGTNV